jgi:hypothetical protein
MNRSTSNISRRERVFAWSESGSSNSPSSIAGSFAPLAWRPLRALRRGPQHVGLREEARALEVQVDHGVIGIGVVQRVDVGDQLKVVRGDTDAALRVPGSRRSSNRQHPRRDL